MSELAQRVAVAEQALKSDLVKIVGNLSMYELAVPAHYRPDSRTQPIPSPLENYTFCSIVPDAEAAASSTSTGAPVGYDNAILGPDGTEWEFDYGRYLDAGYGIGLGWRPPGEDSPRMVCYSGAGVFSYTGTIFIAQLQGSIPVTTRRAEYQQALRSGFWWTDTLVSAWTSVARKIGAAGVHLLPSAEMDWMKDENPELNAQVAAKYDQTAKRMKFKRGDNGAWEYMF